MGRRRAALEDRAAQLAQSLRAAGHEGAAARLSEVIPDGDISNDDHLEMLASYLSELKSNHDISDVQRAEAERLSAIARDLPIGIGMAGTVWIVWVEQTERARMFGAPREPSYYWGSWQSSEGDDHDLYEDGPHFDTLAEALEWAQRRSARIIVRPEWDPSNHYSAGHVETGHGFPPLVRPDAG